MSGKAIRETVGALAVVASLVFVGVEILTGRVEVANNFALILSLCFHLRSFMISSTKPSTSIFLKDLQSKKSAASCIRSPYWY